MSSTRSKLGVTARQWFFFFLAVAPLTVIALGLWWRRGALWGLVLVGAIVAVGVHDLLQRRHSLLRIYPVLGHGRFLAERIRPEIQQYFVESDTNGRPFNREVRSVDLPASQTRERCAAVRHPAAGVHARLRVPVAQPRTRADPRPRNRAW